MIRSLLLPHCSFLVVLTTVRQHRCELVSLVHFAPPINKSRTSSKLRCEDEDGGGGGAQEEEKQPAASLPPAGARPAEGGEPAHVLRQAAAYLLQRFLAHLQCRFVKVYHGHRILVLQNFNNVSSFGCMGLQLSPCVEIEKHIPIVQNCQFH